MSTSTKISKLISIPVTDPTVRTYSKTKVTAPPQDAETTAAVNSILNELEEFIIPKKSDTLILTENLTPSTGPPPLDDIINQISKKQEKVNKTIRKRQDSILIENPQNPVKPKRQYNRKIPLNPAKPKRQYKRKIQQEPKEPKIKPPTKPRKPRITKEPKKPKEPKVPKPKAARKPRQTKKQRQQEDKETQTEVISYPQPDFNKDSSLAKEKIIEQKMNIKQQNWLKRIKEKQKRIINNRIQEKEKAEKTRTEALNSIMEISKQSLQ